MKVVSLLPALGPEFAVRLKTDLLEIEQYADERTRKPQV